MLAAVVCRAWGKQRVDPIATRVIGVVGDQVARTEDSALVARDGDLGTCSTTDRAVDVRRQQDAIVRRRAPRRAASAPNDVEHCASHVRLRRVRRDLDLLSRVDRRRDVATQRLLRVARLVRLVCSIDRNGNDDLMPLCPHVRNAQQEQIGTCIGRARDRNGLPIPAAVHVCAIDLLVRLKHPVTVDYLLTIAACHSATVVHTAAPVDRVARNGSGRTPPGAIRPLLVGALGTALLPQRCAKARPIRKETA